MPTVRIHNLAKELGVKSMQIIDKCVAEGVPPEAVKNHMAVVSEGLAASIREWFGAPPAPQTQVRPHRPRPWLTRTATEAPQATLILAAAPKECRAIAAAWADSGVPTDDWVPIDLGSGIDLARTGVGKSNAILALTQLLPHQPYLAVFNMGICGALPSPGASPGALAYSCNILDTVIATESIYADEGVATPTGFQDLSQLGFPIGGSAFPASSIAADADWLARLRPAFPDARFAPIATVSTCSGTDALALEVTRRTGAIAEAMEGAAVAHALARLTGGAVRFVEIRVVSNTTGDRDKQTWDFPGSFAKLREVAARLRAVLASEQ